MSPGSKKYLKKRKQISNIISEIESVYESNEIYVTARPDSWQSRKAAKEILSKLGISKPEELSKIETKGYSIG